MSDRWIGNCDPYVQDVTFWVTVSLNIITDVILCALPFPALLLITEKRIRAVISFVFGLAGIVVIVSIVRAVLISQHSNGRTTWIILLSHIEITAGLCISAIPEISKYFTKKYLESTPSSSHNTNDATTRSQHLQTRRKTATGVFEPNSDERVKKDGFIGLSGESVRDSDSGDVESGGIPRDESSEQGAWAFHPRESTEKIVTKIEHQEVGNASTGGKKGIVKTTTFEMKVM